MDLYYEFLQWTLGITMHKITDQLEMLVLCQDITVLTSLAPELSMFKVMFSYSLKQIFDTISSIWFILNIDQTLVKLMSHLWKMKVNKLEKWQKLTAGLNPNHKHIFKPWKNRCAKLP